MNALSPITIRKCFLNTCVTGCDKFTTFYIIQNKGKFLKFGIYSDKLYNNYLLQNRFHKIHNKNIFTVIKVIGTSARVYFM